MAAIRFSGGVDTHLAPLAAAISDRRTYRKRFSDRDIPPARLAKLFAAVKAEGACMTVIDGAADPLAVSDLVAQGDAQQSNTPDWRRELAQWMHPRRSGDGLALPGLAAPLARLIIRRFDIGHRIAAKDRDLATHAPLLAVIATDGDTPQDWLSAGQALERLLLTASNAGLQASYLNQPIEIPALRRKLALLIGLTGAPQILFRMGVPDEFLAASPRRPISDVLID